MCASSVACIELGESSCSVSPLCALSSGTSSVPLARVREDSESAVMFGGRQGLMSTADRSFLG